MRGRGGGGGGGGGVLMRCGTLLYCTILYVRDGSGR